MVSSYKYGCVVDEFLELKEMVEDKQGQGEEHWVLVFRDVRQRWVVLQLGFSES